MNLNFRHETKLLTRIQKGDERAFAELFEKFYDKLFGFILGLTHSKQIAEDITQDVFLKIWENRADITAVENINAFLFRLAKNRTIDYLRKSAREILSTTEHLEIDKQDNDLLPLDLLIQDELKNKLSEAIKQLPAQQKKIYTLYKEQGVKQDEIARQLNLSRSTIQSHMNLAVGNIHKYLSAYYPELLIVALLISY